MKKSLSNQTKFSWMKNCTINGKGIIILLFLCFSLNILKAQSSINNSDKQKIIYQVEEENRKLLVWVTPADGIIIENRIKEYEKQNRITDRTDKIYILNTKFEVISVKEQKK